MKQQDGESFVLIPKPNRKVRICLNPARLNQTLIIISYLTVGYDNNGSDHDRTLGRWLQICRKRNLKLNKDECHFRCTSVPFLVRLFPGKT